MLQLYEEPEKPTDALGYLKNSVGGSQDDKTIIAQLREENEQLKAKVSIRKNFSVLPAPLIVVVIFGMRIFLYITRFSRRFVIVILGSFFFYSCTR